MTSESQARVVIIGAGVAGLAAAGHLCEANFKNVVVLEARDRIGGRTYTFPYGPKREIELGAQWIHGEEDNAIYELAKQHGLVDAGASSFLEEDADDFSELERESERDAATDAGKFFREEHDRLSADLEFTKKNCSGSIGEYMEKECQNYLENHGATPEIRNIIGGVFNYYEKIEAHLHGADSLYQVSAKLAHTYRSCKGNNLVVLKHGYATVLDLLLQKFPKEWIKTNADVISVNWFPENICVKPNRKVSQSASGKRTQLSPVEVISSSGSIYPADHVITTIPLGCLKVKGGDMFNPPLPDKKMVAIAAMGFGTVDKIFLEFEEPFWEEECLFIKAFQPLGFKDGKFSSSEFSAKMWYECISYFSRVYHQPNLLCAWIHGDGARHMETLPEEQVLNACHLLLCRILKNDTLPKPTKIIRSNWHSDLYSRGSYSFLSCDCENTQSKNADIEEPVLVGVENYPVLLFGGEATHSHFYSTVHGAYETGIREANRLIQFYGSRCSMPSSVKHLLQGEPKSIVPAQTKSAKIVVVGAGVAGLAAAQKLEMLGFEDVTVIEALHRIGGRVHTIPFGEGVLELGAQWVHGEEGNPLFKYASERGLLCEHNPSLEGSGLFLNDRGEVLPSDLVDEVIMVLDRIHEETYKEKNLQPQCVGELYKQRFEESMVQFPDNSDVRKAIFDWYMRFEVIDNACHDLTTLSVEGYTEWRDCEGMPLINFRNGYGTLVDTLASEVSHIILGEPVRRILWQSKNDQQKPVLVECENGQIFSADHVIITTSVQYLKENMANLFQPLLPYDKQEALQCIGFGTINKIYLVYSEPFWDTADLGFQLIWINPLNEYLRTWVRGVTGFDQVWAQPNVLVGWVGGAAALEVESISESEIGQTCTELLRKFLNRKDIPMPKQVLRSTWNSNPYIRGSYSHRLVGYENSKMNELTKPLYATIDQVQRPIVLFAGEATDQNFFSSVHGALRSGWREAERLASFWDAG